jgi:hypothetical protein
MDILSNAFVSTHFDADSLTSPVMQAYEYGTAKSIFEKLWEVYPGYDWKVRVFASQGVAQVQLGGLMKMTYGEVIKLDALASDPDLSLIKAAGGKLLELLRLRRAKADRVAVRELRARERGLFTFARPMAGGERPQRPTRIITEAEANAMIRAAANARQTEKLAA